MCVLTKPPSHFLNTRDKRRRQFHFFFFISTSSPSRVSTCCPCFCCSVSPPPVPATFPISSGHLPCQSWSSDQPAVALHTQTTAGCCPVLSLFQVLLSAATVTDTTSGHLLQSPTVSRTTPATSRCRRSPPYTTTALENRVGEQPLLLLFHGIPAVSDISSHRCLLQPARRAPSHHHHVIAATSSFPLLLISHQTLMSKSEEW